MSSQVVRMTVPNNGTARPTTLREVGHRIWLETLNMLAEYGTLVIFSALAAMAEAVRQKEQLPVAANAGFIVAEAATALTMIAPKAIRAVGEVIQVIGIAGHDAAYAVAHGRRRAPME